MEQVGLEPLHSRLQSPSVLSCSPVLLLPGTKLARAGLSHLTFSNTLQESRQTVILPS